MILMNTLYYIYIHMNIFRIGLKIIEETEYELKEISIHWFQKSIIIFQIWLSIFDTYIIQFILHASSIKTTVFRMFNLHRIALCLIQSNKRIQSKVLCLNIKQAVCDNVIPCYRNLFFTNIFTEVAQYRWRTKTVVISGQDRSRATLVKRRCLLMISIIPRTSSVAGSKEPISSKVGVYFNY